MGKQLLDKENHKFQYKEVEKGGRAQKYYSSIEWLLSADIITTARLVTDVMYTRILNWRMNICMGQEL